MHYLKIITLFLYGTIHTLMAQNPAATTFDPNTKNAVLDSVAQALSHYYVYPDKAAAMIHLLKKQATLKLFDTLTNPNDIGHVITKQIRAVYYDRHLQIRYDPALAERIQIFLATKQPDVTDYQREKQHNFYFKKVEILPANIGYLEFTNFADTSKAARQTVRAALQFVANTDALIIDLRNNFGGNGIMLNEILSYFFAEKTLIGRNYNRLTNEWTAQWIVNDFAITNGLQLNMPAYILTSKRTFSAAEGLAYHLKYLKNAIIIGDTTRGGAHLTRSFNLGNGFVGFIPYTRSEQVMTGTDWEGTGVIPNFYTSEENAMLYTQQAILNKKLQMTKDETEQRKITWLLDELKTKTEVFTIPLNELSNYIGEYEEFVITIKDEQLICTNTHQLNKTDVLIPISATLFQVDAQLQIAYIQNTEGQYDSIQLRWNDGWVDLVKKTKNK
ncbi:MAG: S41 family peptidase [Saprospiraceae bacterium]